MHAVVARSTFPSQNVKSTTCSDHFEGSDVVFAWGLLRRFCVTGAALRMTRLHFCEAGAALYADAVEKSRNASVRGRQLCTQLSIFEGSLAELLRF